MAEQLTVPAKWRLWPGLARLWFRGDFSSLLEAVAFGALLDLWLLSTFLWTGWLEPRLRWPLVVFLGAWWIYGYIKTSRPESLRPLKHAVDHELQLERLRAAQLAMLQEHWTEAEQNLQLMLAEDPRDILAGLMLSKVMRLSGRPHESLSHLQRLRKFDQALPWWSEIRSEETLVGLWLAANSSEVSNEGVSPVAESSEAGHDAVVDHVLTEDLGFDNGLDKPETEIEPQVNGDSIGQTRATRNHELTTRETSDLEQNETSDLPRVAKPLKRAA